MNVVQRARLPEGLKGYHRDEVDAYLNRIVAEWPTSPVVPSTNPSADHAFLTGDVNKEDGEAASVHGRGLRRENTKRWGHIALDVTCAVVFLSGCFVIFLGVATWHSVTYRPHAIAQVHRQFNCVNDASGDTGPACDEWVVFRVGDRQIHTEVRSIDPGRDLYGPPGHQRIAIFYDPHEPSHIEAVNGVAFQGTVIALCGLAAVLGATIVYVRKTRRRKS